MFGKTGKLTTAAMLTALCMVCMTGACLLPFGSLVLLVVAAFVPVAAVLRCGLGWGALCYAASAVLTLLLFPGRLKGLLFVVLLGHYGVSKSLIERLRNLPLEWVCKLLLCSAALALGWWLYTSVFAQNLSLPYSLWLIWGAATVAFVIFDLGLTTAIGWFQRRFSGQR